MQYDLARSTARAKIKKENICRILFTFTYEIGRCPRSSRGNHKTKKTYGSADYWKTMAAEVNDEKAYDLEVTFVRFHTTQQEMIRCHGNFKQEEKISFDMLKDFLKRQTHANRLYI